MHTIDMKIAKDHPPHDMNFMGGGSGGAPPPPLLSDIKYAVSWVWTKNLIGSTPPSSFGDDAPGWVWGFLVLFLLSWRAGVDGQFNFCQERKTVAPSLLWFSMGYSQI